ncbi:hypothetical protein FACS1894190_17520 [Spirochaetia bacterium]|nr:hypothetical protein FACS1894190_17520 [Spirochaetia bacterium]
MNDNDRIDWHIAFIQALKLDFEAYSGILDIYDNVHLTAEPLKIDAVIIKKLQDGVIHKNIAAIFRTDNIVEYKNPEVYLSIPDFEKTLAYTHLYASLNKMNITDLSLSIIVTKEPRQIEKYLKSAYGQELEKSADGIYLVKGFSFPLQILMSGGLPAQENLFLNGLRPNLNAAHIENLLKTGKEFDIVKLRPYLEVICRANYKVVEEIRKMSSKTFDEWLVEIGLEATAEAIGEARGEARGEAIGEARGKAIGKAIGKASVV